jgi:hypothetical protein
VHGLVAHSIKFAVFARVNGLGVAAPAPPYKSIELPWFDRPVSLTRATRPSPSETHPAWMDDEGPDWARRPATLGTASLLLLWPSTTTPAEVIRDVVRVEVVQLARPDAARLDERLDVSRSSMTSSGASGTC